MPADIGEDELGELQQTLLASFKRSLQKMPDAFEQLDQLLGTQITIGMLCDIVAYTINLDLESKVRLLAEVDVMRRAELLLQAIDGRPTGAGLRTFPPRFSVNYLSMEKAIHGPFPLKRRPKKLRLLGVAGRRIRRLQNCSTVC